MLRPWWRFFAILNIVNAHNFKQYCESPSHNTITSTTLHMSFKNVRDLVKALQDSTLQTLQLFTLHLRVKIQHIHGISKALVFLEISNWGFSCKENVSTFGIAGRIVWVMDQKLLNLEHRGIHWVLGNPRANQVDNHYERVLWPLIDWI